MFVMLKRKEIVEKNSTPVFCFVYISCLLEY